MSLPAEGTIWVHYKGGLYIIVGHAQHTERQEPLVLYRSWSKGHLGTPMFARPIDVWYSITDSGTARFRPRMKDDR